VLVFFYWVKLYGKRGEERFMIILLDNYDSFVYNLYQYIRELGVAVEVFRNDEITVSEVEVRKPTHIVLSPGPCTPNEAGISVELVRAFAGKCPILGVCLGHQSIGQAFGGKVIRAKRPVHGKSSLIRHDGKGVYNGLVSPLAAARYHSLVVQDEGLPNILQAVSYSADGELMGIRHRRFTVEGVQFHPESILTGEGKRILANFLAWRGGEWIANLAAGQAS